MSKKDRYSFCESAVATSFSRWHIRKLTEHGPKYGGGVDTPSLCGHIDPERLGGWDLEVGISDAHLEHACSKCREKYLEAIR